jgi:hypothetical protein
LKLIWKNGKPVLLLLPNFAVLLSKQQVRYVSVNGSKYVIVYIGDEPVHMEPVTEPLETQ